jgi:hypothetical protein
MLNQHLLTKEHSIDWQVFSGCAKVPLQLANLLAALDDASHSALAILNGSFLL